MTNVRSGLVLVAVLLSALTALAQPRKSLTSNRTVRAGKASTQRNVQDINALLEPVRKEHDLPALAAAVVLRGRTVALAAVGVRKYGGRDRVTVNDKFHIGSCTKAMTATLIARLVEQDKLRWDTTIAEALPALRGSMHPAYRKVTLLQLLSHRGGLPPSERSWPAGRSFLDLHRLPGSPRDQRLAYAEMMLRQRPEAAPGSKYVYSNAGYATAGVIVEQVTDTEWEELMIRMLFDPLDMNSAGFGPMGTPGRVDQPRQHRLEGDRPEPVEPGPLSDNPAVIGPAGTVHCSIGDWARFVAAHLPSAQGEGRLLDTSTLEVLHTPAFGGEYAPGWIVTERDWGGGKVLTHAGSNSMNFAVAWLAPQRDFAVVVATNVGGDRAFQGCDKAAATLIRRFVAGDS